MSAMPETSRCERQIHYARIRSGTHAPLAAEDPEYDPKDQSYGLSAGTADDVARVVGVHAAVPARRDPVIGLGG